MSESLQPAEAAQTYEALRERVAQVVVGQESAVRLVFITLLCSGHALVEGVPGVAKTLLVRTLSQALGVRFGRIQFTPDLMPADITGSSVLGARERELEFRPGPVFTDLLLADEINRASAKTQAALLEAMQERSVTVDGTSHPLGPDFAVFATQNPVEQEGTYPLPEAELDRFLFKIVMGYPSEEEERALLVLHHAGEGNDTASLPQPLISSAELAQLRRAVLGVIVRDEIVSYVAALVRSTRADFQYVLGASPRAGLLLLQAAKANAALEARDFVLPEDVQEVFFPALRHRVELDPASEVEGLTADRALERTLRSVTVPR